MNLGTSEEKLKVLTEMLPQKPEIDKVFYYVILPNTKSLLLINT